MTCCTEEREPDYALWVKQARGQFLWAGPCDLRDGTVTFTTWNAHVVDVLESASLFLIAPNTKPPGHILQRELLAVAKAVFLRGHSWPVNPYSLGEPGFLYCWSYRWVLSKDELIAPKVPPKIERVLRMIELWARRIWRAIRP